MSLSKISAACRGCPFADTCDHKKMESVATVTVKISENIACKDELEKQLRADLYEHLHSGLLEG